MKIRLNNLLKPRIVLLTIVLLIASCQKDDSFEENKDSIANNGKIEFKRVSLNEIKQSNILKRSLDKIGKHFDVLPTNMSNANSKIDATDNSFSILTDEIIQVNANNKETYTFRIETPTVPESSFENFIIEKLEDGTVHFYIYRYIAKDQDLDEDFPFSLSKQYIDPERIQLDSFNDYLSKVLYDTASGCLIDVSGESGVLIITILSCEGGFGSGGSGPGSGGSGSGCDCTNDNFGITYGEWEEVVVGENSCIRFRYVYYPAGGFGYQTQTIPCGIGNADYDSHITESYDGSSNYDPLHDGAGGGGTSSSDTTTDSSQTTVAVLPDELSQEQKMILDCLGDRTNEIQIRGLTRDQQEAISDYLSERSSLNGDGNGPFLPNCANPSALEFVVEAIAALLNGGDVDFEEKRINGIKIDSTVTPCLQNLILDLMLGNFPYSSAMGNIELIEDTFDTLGGGYSPSPLGFVVTYKIANITGNGHTVQLPYNSATQTINVEVTIDEDLINNGTILAIVKTILHESIHAYLIKLKQENPTYFNNSNEFSQLILDYQSYSNDNDPQHIYMGSIITNMANNISNFVQEKYGYPQSSIDYYEAVCWSGITHLTNGSLNPMFTNLYSSYNDQQNIIKIFNTENGTASYIGYLPLIDNNCN